jgi:hypothetical protein
LGVGGIATGGFGAIERGILVTGTNPAVGVRVESSNGSGGILEMYAENGGSTFDTRGSGHLRWASVSDEFMRLDPYGRLLIGTATSPSVGNGQYAHLVVQGNTTATDGDSIVSLQRGQTPNAVNAGNALGLITFGYSTGASAASITGRVDATSGGVNGNPGRLDFNTEDVGSDSGPKLRMSIDSSGSTTFMRVNNNSPELIFGYGTQSGIYAGIGGENNFNTNQYCDLLFYTNGNSGERSPEERMRITSGGTLQLGYPNAVGSTAMEMFVGGTDGSYSIIRGKYNRFNDYNRSEIRFGVEDNNSGLGFLAFATGNNTAYEAMRIDSSRNVGIGITNPAAGASAGSNRILNIASGAVGGVSHITFGDSHAVGKIESVNGNGTIAINATEAVTVGTSGSSTERLRVHSDGDITIGTAERTQNDTGRQVVTVNGTSDSLINFTHSDNLAGWVYASSSEFRLESVGSRALNLRTSAGTALQLGSDGDASFMGAVQTDGGMFAKTSFQLTRAGGNQVTVGGSDTYALWTLGEAAIIQYDGQAKFSTGVEVGTWPIRTDINKGRINVYTNSASQANLLLAKTDSQANSTAFLLCHRNDNSEMAVIGGSGSATFADSLYIKPLGNSAAEVELASSQGSGGVIYLRDGAEDRTVYINGATGEAQFREMTNLYNVLLRPYNGDGADQFQIRKGDDVRASITGAGGATFDSTVNIGGFNLANTSASGIEVRSHGELMIQRPSDQGSSSLIDGRLGDAQTINILATGETNVGGYSGGSTTTSGVLLGAGGGVFSQMPAAASGAGVLFQGMHGSTFTSQITAGGQATFASQVTTSDRFESNRTNATDYILRGTQGGTENVVIRANGETIFKSYMQIERDDTAIGGLATVLYLTGKINGVNAGHMVYKAGGQLELRNSSNNPTISTSPSGVLFVGQDTKQATNHPNRWLQVGHTSKSTSYIEVRTSTGGSSGLLFSDGTAVESSGYRGAIEYSHVTDTLSVRAGASTAFTVNGTGIQDWHTRPTVNGVQVALTSDNSSLLSSLSTFSETALGTSLIGTNRGRSVNVNGTNNAFISIFSNMTTTGPVGGMNEAIGGLRFDTSAGSNYFREDFQFMINDYVLMTLRDEQGVGIVRYDADEVFSNGDLFEVIGDFSPRGRAGARDSNVIIGTSAATNINSNGQTGSLSNVMIGASAGFNLTDGNRNVAIGGAAGDGLTTGDKNILIGYHSGSTNDITGDHNIVIDGSNSPCHNLASATSNRIVMGGTAVTNAYVQVGWTTVSDKRDKVDLGEVPYGLEFVKELQPRTYQFKLDRDGEDTPENVSGNMRYGFMAQDILELEHARGSLEGIIINEENEDKLTFNESNLVPVLVNAIQDLSKENEDLKSKLELLMERVDALENA